MSRLLSAFVACAVIAQALVFSLVPARADVNPSLYSGLQWRSIGPFRGGRALAVTGVPGDPVHFYFGSVDGGVWESHNAGRTWNPIFDQAKIGSIGAIAVAPSNPNVVYVGSGEADMRSDIASGNGMYKSTDGGKTWMHIGLEDSRQLGKIVVDPKNADVAYVAALGHQYSANAERGVFKTTDGGKSWSKILFKDDDTGAIDISMKPDDSKTLLASLWQTRRPPWNIYPPSSGPGSGLYITHDAGSTWKHVTSGLPERVGHIGISYSPANPKRVYAQVDAATEVARGGVYRSDDGGETWSWMAGGKDQIRIWQRGWYFGGITADPKNADDVYVMNTSTYRSTDGGKTFIPIKGAPGGDDYHTLWIDPTTSDRMILGCDQGVIVSVDGAQTWSSWYNQPTAQFYHVAVDNQFPYWVYGAQQDSGAMSVPSRTTHQKIGFNDWRAIDAGGESGYIAADPLHKLWLFGSNGLDERTDTDWEHTSDETLAYPTTLWRNEWTLPMAFSPADKTSLYASHQQVFRSRDRGESWQIVSPDLTRPKVVVPSNLDRPTAADNEQLARTGVVYAIAPSPRSAGTIWAGTDDGLIWVTRDNSKHWQNVTPPELTPWSHVDLIDASHFATGTAYAAVDRHRLDDLTPYVYRTRDYGAHWTRITNGIPNGSFVNAVREDPKQHGLLYAGTEHGIYVSFNDGNSWQSLQSNLPTTSIRDIAFAGDDVVIATHGRSFWVLDDASALRQIAANPSAAQERLFKPALAFRLRPGNDEATPIPHDEALADNPPAGAIFDYYLASNATTPVVLQVIDRRGQVVHKWSSADKPQTPDYAHEDIPASWLPTPPLPSAAAGQHRFIWDFTYADGVLAPPGQYTVRMSANGATSSQTFTVARDPRLHVRDADLVAQYQFAQAIETRKTEIAALRKRIKEPSRAAGNPDNSMGMPGHDFSSLRFLANAYANLENASQSADAAPSKDMRKAMSALDAIFTRARARALKGEP